MESDDLIMLAKSWRIAVEIHAFLVDRGGESYLFHVARVAMALHTPLEQVCGLLHDVLEDGSDTWALTIEKEFPPEVLACCVALCRWEGEDYLRSYIPRVAANALATKVKFVDLADNMRPERLALLPDREEALRLLERYGKAYKLLVMSKAQ